jgi:hypothetical protein
MLTIDSLKFLCEGCEREISIAHIVQGDAVLIHQVHPIDKLTIVGVVWIREDTVQ